MTLVSPFIRSMVIAVLIFAVFSAAYAGDSSGLHGGHFVVKEQQPTTLDDNTVKPTIVEPEQGGVLSCPTGYALTSVDTKKQSSETITVYQECNGVGAYYVHVWCRNAPDNHSAVTKAPTLTYTCRKLQNQWVTVDATKG